jgi:hypothetical protein
MRVPNRFKSISQSLQRAGFLPLLCDARRSGIRPIETIVTRSALTALDPKATFKVGPVNGREGRESGLRLKASAVGLPPKQICSPVLMKARAMLGRDSSEPARQAIHRRRLAMLKKRTAA